MQAQSQSRWFVSAIVGLLIILTLLSGYFLLPERLARHLLERLSEESGVEILPVRVDYSLLSGELVLKDSDLYLAPGLQVSADEVRLRIPLSQLRDSSLHVDRLSLQSPYINIDLDRLGREPGISPSPLQHYLSTSVSSFELGKGGLFLSRSGQGPVATSLAYQSMHVNANNNGELTMTANGLSEKGDWSFIGMLELGAVQLNGELDIRNMPLEVILRAFPGTQLERLEQATVNASQSIVWNPERGVSLEGSLTLTDGKMVLADNQKLRWKELELFGFSYVQGEYSVVRGTLNRARIFMDQGALALLPAQLSALTELELNQVDVFSHSPELKESNENVVLKGLNGQLIKAGESSLALKGTAYARSGVPVAIESSFDNQGQGQARLNLRKLDLDKAPETYRMVSGYNLAGSQINAVMQVFWKPDSRTTKGRLTFIEFRAAPESHSAADWNVSLIRAAMTDNKGRIAVTVPEQALPDESLSSALAGIMLDSIDNSFIRVTENPYGYLARLSGSQEPLTESLDYVPGRPVLCSESDNTVNQWINVLNRRPALDLSFQGRASRKTDWESLAQVELESDLLELYSALSRKELEEVTEIPLQKRLQLIEQMYLRIHNRRLPDIGEESQAKRAARAERWLLTNWPLKSESLVALAKQRAETLKNCMNAAGVASERLHIEPAQVVEGPAQMQFRLLY